MECRRHGYLCRIRIRQWTTGITTAQELASAMAFGKMLYRDPTSGTETTVSWFTTTPRTVW